MSAQDPGPLAEAIGRIWAQITVNSSDIDDMFERMIQSFYSKVVRPGNTVIDGGAHTGRHTIPLARQVGTDGLVIAFEPLPSAARKLTELLAGSGLNGNVQLRTEALSNEPGRRAFFIVNNMLEFSGLRSRTYVGFVPDHTEVTVDVDTIDAAVKIDRSSGSISFIKLDLEGGEFRALQGAEQTLRTYGPCCVFENGLGSSADGYGADEFFGFFERIGYELYDVLGCPVDDSRWSQPGPNYFVAMPRARSRELLPCLWTSALEQLLTPPWSPVEPLGPPPLSFVSEPPSSAQGVTGHLDRVETSIMVSGWAGDLRSGRPARSVLITIDGVPVATADTGKRRHDVAGATGQVGFAQSGFEVRLRKTSGQCVEVHGEVGDGRFVKLIAS